MYEEDSFEDEQASSGSMVLQASSNSKNSSKKLYESNDSLGKSRVGIRFEFSFFALNHLWIYDKYIKILSFFLSRFQREWDLSSVDSSEIEHDSDTGLVCRLITTNF